MIVFVKPLSGYVPGERAGFSPERERLLVDSEIAYFADKESEQKAAPKGAGAVLSSRQAAAVVSGKEIPEEPGEQPGGEVTDAENFSKPKPRRSRAAKKKA